MLYTESGLIVNVMEEFIIALSSANMTRLPLFRCATAECVVQENIGFLWEMGVPSMESRQPTA